jgi:hypothetical protein
LLIPQVRRWLGARFRRAAGRYGPPRDPTIDLDPQDWRREPDQRLTDRRKQPPPKRD